MSRPPTQGAHGDQLAEGPGPGGVLGQHAELVVGGGGQPGHLVAGPRGGGDRHVEPTLVLPLRPLLLGAEVVPPGAAVERGDLLEPAETERVRVRERHEE